MNYNIEKIDLTLAGIYTFVSDFMKFLDRNSIKLEGRIKPGVKARITDSELISIGILRSLLGMECIKSFYSLGRNILIQCFPKLPHYEGLIKGLNRTVPTQIMMLQILLMMSKKSCRSTIFLVDATPYPVCHNKRIFTHKVFDGLAKRGKSSMGWFYGFKLHLVTDQFGQLLALQITSGQINERQPLYQLLNSLKGTVIADAAYLSKDLTKELWKKSMHLFTGVRSNMKKIMSNAQHQLLKSRQRIEVTFGLLKQRFALVSSLPRSVMGGFSRICCSFLAYIFAYQRQSFGY
jgi:transposase